MKLSEYNQIEHHHTQKFQAYQNDRNSSETGINPGVFFWKFLPRVNNLGLNCLVPDTLILNDGQIQASWIYTNEEGFIEKLNSINIKDFTKKLNFQTSPEQLVAILKKPTFKNDLVVGNDIRLLNSRALTSLSFSSTDGVNVIQRFIKSNGSKAFICRTIYKQIGKSESLIITNNNQFQNHEIPEMKRYVAKLSKQSLIVKTGSGKHFNQTVKYLKNIVHFLNWAHGIILSQIVGDFIKDQMGNWWLINIKGFKITKEIKRTHKSCLLDLTKTENTDFVQKHQKQKYQKTKTCKYCEKAYIQSQLKYKMTIKMIIQTDRHLLHRGKTFKWLKRSDIGNIQTHSLYQQHRVCQRCYKLYMFTQELMEIECKFAQKLGIPITQESKFNLVMSVGSNYLQKQSKTRQIDKLQKQIPEQIQLGPNSKLLIKNNYPMKNDEIISKMIRYRFIIYLVSIDEITKFDKTKNYFIQYSFINCKIRYKIDLGGQGKKILHLNKLRVIYLFSHNRKLFNQFLSTHQFLTINIVSQSQDKKQRIVWGKLELQLKDFLSDKVIKRQYYKMFNLKDGSWGWGLSANIGLIDSNGEVDTSRTIFKNFKGLVYYPESSDYYSCQPLPLEWITLIKQKNIQKQDIQKQLSNKQEESQQQTYHKRTGISKVSNHISQAHKILFDQIAKYQKIDKRTMPNF